MAIGLLVPGLPLIGCGFLVIQGQYYISVDPQPSNNQGALTRQIVPVTVPKGFPGNPPFLYRGLILKRSYLRYNLVTHLSTEKRLSTVAQVLTSTAEHGSREEPCPPPFTIPLFSQPALGWGAWANLELG